MDEEMQQETVPRNPWPIPTRSTIPYSNDWKSSRWRSLSTMGCSCRWRSHSPFYSTRIFSLKEQMVASFKKVLISCFWGNVLVSSKRCLPWNVYTENLGEEHSRPLIHTSTNNGSRHRVRPLHGGIGKVPGGLLINQKVKEETSKSLEWTGSPVIDSILTKISQDVFQAFNLFCYRWIVYSWWRSTASDGRCKDNTSNDPFQDVKVCKNLVTDEIEDHRIQSGNKMNCNIQKERTLHLVLRLRGETERQDARHQWQYDHQDQEDLPHSAHEPPHVNWMYA